MIRLCFFLSLFSVPFFGLYNLNPNPRQLERNFQRKKNKKKTTKIAKQSKKEICVINEKNVSVNNLRFIRRVKMARVFSFYSLLFFSSFHRIVSMRKKSTEGGKKTSTDILFDRDECNKKPNRKQCHELHSAHSKRSDWI